MNENLNEAIYRYFYKDEEALPQMIQFFRPAVIMILFGFIQGNSLDDAHRAEYLLLADEVLVKCLHNCRTDQYQTFKAFYRVVYHNALVDTVRLDKEIQYRKTYEIIALDDSLFETKIIYRADYTTDPKINVHASVMAKIANEYLESRLREEFSEFECKIVHLREVGFTNREIADMYAITTRKVCYIVAKIRKWLSLIDTNE